LRFQEISIWCAQNVPKEAGVAERVKFTIDRINRIAPDPGGSFEVFDTEEKGLFLRVSPGGTKSWGLRYRAASGAHRRLKLGRAPDVKPEQARSLATAARAEIAKGVDPSAVRKAHRRDLTQAATVGTVAEIGERYFSAGGRRTRGVRKVKRESTLSFERDHFDRHIVPSLGDEPIRDLTRGRVQRFIDSVAFGAKPSVSAARQSRAALSAICSFAVDQGVIDENPVRSVVAPGFEPRERFLTESEVKRLWLSILGAGESRELFVSRPVAIAVQLALVTLQRRAEIAGAKKSEIDIENGLWTIPRERTKNGRTHVVPLSPMARSLIAEAGVLSPDSEYLFPSPRSARADKPIEAPAMSHAFRRICASAGLRGVRLHDLRRTGASNMTAERLMVPRFIVSRVLNHTSDAGGAAAITAVYDRNDYLAEKRQALDAWAGRLVELVATNGDASRDGA
jgi:integrase